MFESSLTSAGAARRPFVFAVSLGAQALVLASLGLATVLHVQDLPAGDWTRVLIAPAPPAAAPSPPQSQPVRRVAPQRFNTELRQPDRIPEKVAVLVEEQPAVANAAPSLGVVDSVPGGVPGGIGAILGNPAAIPPPPPPAPPPVVAERDPGPLRVSSGVQAAKLVRRVAPDYPPLARQARVHGTVRLQAVISGSGEIERIEALSGHPLLVRAAIDAVRQWRYRPTLLNGRPTAVITQIEVHFRLG